MNNSKIKVTIDEEGLGKEIHELVIAKTKHLLRNDPEISEKIDKVVDAEVTKRVNSKLLHIDSRYIDQLILKTLNINSIKVQQLASKQMIILLKKLPLYQELLKEQNEKAIKELFKGEY